MSEKGNKSGKSVSDIIIERILKDVDERGFMPWQRPYEIYNSFNYFTKESYKGINRLLLPFGEYLTRNQINEYNRTHNTDYRFQKGIQWYPVVFFKREKKDVTVETVQELLDSGKVEKWDSSPNHGVEYLFRHEGWVYCKEGISYYKKRNILRYTPVAERHFFANSKGELLPSRIELGEVEIVQSKPNEVLDNYIEKEGIEVQYAADIPCYFPQLDMLRLNKYAKTPEAYYATSFHECAHSTGHPSRLNRESLISNTKEMYAVDECIAEITACLLCAETGISTFETSCTYGYSNNLAYINGWKKRIKDWGKEFIYIVSQADRAFNYIMSASEENWEEETL